MYPLGSDPNQCPEGLHRCYNGQCVVDLNLCPTSTLIPNVTEISPTSASPLQSSSSYMSLPVDIVTTSVFYKTETSVKETTTVSMQYVTHTTIDHTPDTDNDNELCKCIHTVFKFMTNRGYLSS